MKKITGTTRTEKYEKKRQKMKEMVNHPDHYNREGAIECIDEMVMIWGRFEVSRWCAMTAYKYRYRAGLKGSAEEDIKKSDWYMNKAKELGTIPVDNDMPTNCGSLKY